MKGVKEAVVQELSNDKPDLDSNGKAKSKKLFACEDASRVIVQFAYGDSGVGERL